MRMMRAISFSFDFLHSTRALFSFQIEWTNTVILSSPFIHFNFEQNYSITIFSANTQNATSHLLLNTLVIGFHAGMATMLANQIKTYFGWSVVAKVQAGGTSNNWEISKHGCAIFFLFSKYLYGSLPKSGFL